MKYGVACLCSHIVTGLPGDTYSNLFDLTELSDQLSHHWHLLTPDIFFVLFPWYCYIFDALLSISDKVFLSCFHSELEIIICIKTCEAF